MFISKSKYEELLKENKELKNQLNIKEAYDTNIVDNSFETKMKAIKSHLLTKGNITSWEAIQKYNATRLSAIIFNLKRNGMDITTTPEEYNNTRFVRYHLNKAVK